MRKDARLNRLKKLQYMLNNHDTIFINVKFDMGLWADDGKGDIPKTLSCGSAACALGSATYYPPFMRAGLKMGLYAPMYKQHVDSDAGVEFFGITCEESSWLFDPDLYKKTNGRLYSGSTLPRYVTPEVVAKRVKALIKAYSNSNTPETGILTDDFRYGLGK